MTTQGQESTDISATTTQTKPLTYFILFHIVKVVIGYAMSCYCLAGFSFMWL